MADFPRNIILITLPRSGTHVVKELIARHLKIRMERVNSHIDLDEINFRFNNDKNNLYVVHYNYFEHLSRGEIDRFNAIVENRNIYIIFLDRKDMYQQALSYALLEKFNFEASNPNLLQPKFKVRIKKADLENSYANYARLRYHNNLDRIPITVHQKIFYEDVIENGLWVKGTLVPWVLRDNDFTVKKNPDKELSVINYDQAMKWMDGFSKIYNEKWDPDLKWGNNE